MLKLVHKHAPILSQTCIEVTEGYTLDLPPAFFDDMFALMAERHGVGLAAPQIGIPLRIFVMSYGAITTEFINPVITRTPGKIVTSHDEGCLSFPGLKVSKRRHKRVTIEGYDRNWEPLRFDLRGLAAFIVQHEIDHLNGITIARTGK